MQHPLSFSYSKLSDYAKCPFYFKCRSIDRIRVEEQEILVKGSVIHAILAKYTIACYKAGKTQLFEEWEKIASEVIAEMNVLPEYESEILTDVKAYVEGNEIELEGLAGVEEKIAIGTDYNLMGWMDDAVWFRAIFDKIYLAEEMCKISDYKTGYSMSPDQFQLEIYAWLAYHIYPQLEFVQVEFDFTRFSYKKLVSIGKERLPSIERKILHRIAKISSDKEFKPKINMLCSRCPFWNVCPAMARNEYASSVIPFPKNEAEAKKMLEGIVVLEKNAEEVKKVLKLYCEENGNIRSGDIEASIRPIITKKWDMEGLLKWSKQTGIDLTNALTINNTKIKRYNPPVELMTEEIGTRFRIGGIQKKTLDNDE